MSLNKMPVRYCIDRQSEFGGAKLFHSGTTTIMSRSLVGGANRVAGSTENFTV
jgi:hypothetical protein